MSDASLLLTRVLDLFPGRAARATRPLPRRRGMKTSAPHQVETLEPRLALTQTVGLFRNETASVSEGYTLFGNNMSRDTYLIDTNGQIVNTWTGAGGQTSSYLLPNGNLLRNTALPPQSRVFGSNGNTGLIQELRWDGTEAWRFELQTAKYQLHHDAIKLPNGNVLAIAWERFTKEEAVGMGRNPALTNPAHAGEIWSEAIFEIKVDYTDGVSDMSDVVWEWHLTDHIVQNFDRTKANFGYVKANPQLVNFNYVPRGIGADTHIADWAHFNSIAYNDELKQIIVSSREFSEIWIIEHTESSEIAAGHEGGRYGRGGDLLWRYGNPASWNGGTRANQTLLYQHNAHWIPSTYPGGGNIMVFNNGWNRPNGASFSSAMELVPAKTATGAYRYGQARIAWSYADPNRANFFAPIISGANRLPNGNTLIDEGTRGRIFEVTPAKKIVWVYVNPVAMGSRLKQGTAIPKLTISTGLNGTPNLFQNLTFRAERYAPTYPAFTVRVGDALQSRDLSPKGTIETYPT